MVWNVWIMNDNDIIIRLEWFIVIICKEFEKLFINICVLSEVRYLVFGYIKEGIN